MEICVLEKCWIYNELADIPDEFIVIARSSMQSWVTTDIMFSINATFFGGRGQICNGVMPSGKHNTKSWTSFWYEDDTIEIELCDYLWGDITLDMLRHSQYSSNPTMAKFIEDNISYNYIKDKHNKKTYYVVDMSKDECISLLRNITNYFQ